MTHAKIFQTLFVYLKSKLTLAHERHGHVVGVVAVDRPECDEWSSVAFETTRGRKMQYIKYKGKQAAVPPATGLH